MPRRRSGIRRPTHRRKYEWEWAGFFGQFNTSPGSLFATWARVPASKVDTANSSGIPYVIPDDHTLVRTRVVLRYGTTNGGAQRSYPWTLAFGLIAWDGTTDDTNDLGIMPDPYYDQDLDWIWRNEGPLVLENIADGANSYDLDGVQSKAMRKLSAGTGLLFIGTVADPLENISDPINLTLAVNIRMLFKQV